MRKTSILSKVQDHCLLDVTATTLSNEEGQLRPTFIHP